MKTLFKYKKPLRWWYHKVLCEIGWIRRDKIGWDMYYHHLDMCCLNGFNLYGEPFMGQVKTKPKLQVAFNYRKTPCKFSWLPAIYNSWSGRHPYYEEVYVTIEFHWLIWGFGWKFYRKQDQSKREKINIF